MLRVLLLLLSGQLCLFVLVLGVESCNVLGVRLELGCVVFVQAVEVFKVLLVRQRFLFLHGLEGLSQPAVFFDQPLTFVCVLVRVDHHLLRKGADVNLKLLALAFTVAKHRFVIFNVLLEVVKNDKLFIEADQHVSVVLMLSVQVHYASLEFVDVVGLLVVGLQVLHPARTGTRPVP